MYCIDQDTLAESLSALLAHPSYGVRFEAAVALASLGSALPWCAAGLLQQVGAVKLRCSSSIAMGLRVGLACRRVTCLVLVGFCFVQMYASISPPQAPSVISFFRLSHLSSQPDWNRAVSQPICLIS